MYNNLVPKVYNIGTSRFVLKTKYDDNILDPEKKIIAADKKYLMLVELLKKQIIILRLLKEKVKYLIFLV